MSISSGDILDTVPVHVFDFVASTAALNAKAGKKQAKKRKAATASLSSASEAQNAESSQTSAYYLQLAVDNLMLALAKETEQSIQTKIQFVLAKTQHILLNTAESTDSDSEDHSHSQLNDIQNLKSDMNARFNQICGLISDLKSALAPAVSAAENPATIPAVADLTQNSALNSIPAVEKLTYVQALRNQGLEESTSTENSQHS